MFFTAVTIPPFCSWIFAISVYTGFSPSSETLTSSSFSPENMNFSDNWNRFLIVVSNGLESPIITNSDVGWDRLQISSFSRFVNLLPIVRIVSLEGLSPKLKSGSKNGSVFLPNIGLGCFRANIKIQLPSGLPMSVSA